MKSTALAIAVALIAFVPAARADIETKPVQFKRGERSATIKGALKGYQTIDYTLRAWAGQKMTVVFRSTNASAYFNLLPPGSNNEAIHIGSTAGNDWSGALPADGLYKVRTYLMRNAARRNETAAFTLRVGIDGAAGGTAAR